MGETVLLVDDDHLLLQMYEQRLARNEYEVLTAESGEACLELLEQRTPRAIVLDLAMPGGLDGFDVLRRIKENPSWRDIPVVVFSSRGAPEDIDTALSLGAVGYIVKTQSTPNDVVEKVRAVLDVAGSPGSLPNGSKGRTALQLEESFLCPQCGAPMLLDIVTASGGSTDLTRSLVCPNGCKTT